MGHIHAETPPVGPSFKSYSLRSQDLSSGDNWVAGWYLAPAADTDRTNAAPTQTYGDANATYAAHAFIVASGVGTTDGSTLVLTVSGTSITDSGGRTANDNEVIVADCTSATLDTYFETTKKWLGTVTFTLTSDGATFNFTFNYGLCKYEDFGNRTFKVTDFEGTGLATATDSDFDIVLYHHTSADWTYHATAFVPGGETFGQLTTLHGAESDLSNGEPFAFKIAGINHVVYGAASEGIVIKVVTTAVKASNYINLNLGVIT